MWDLVPRTGIEPRPPALECGALVTGPPGKFHKHNFNTLLLPWTRSAEHQPCMTPTLCIPQLNTGEKSCNRTDGFHFKSLDDKPQADSAAQQAHFVSWPSLHPAWDHCCTLEPLSSDFPRTVPLDPQTLSFPHVLPTDEKYRGPLNDMGLNCKRPLVSDFSHFILTIELHNLQFVESLDIKLHHQIWLCYTPVETPSLSGSYDTLNEIQTPRSVQQSTAWSDPCLTLQRLLLPLFPHPTYFKYTGLLGMSWMCVPWLLLPLLRPLGVLLIYLRGSCLRFLHSLTCGLRLVTELSSLPLSHTEGDNDRMRYLSEISYEDCYYWYRLFKAQLTPHLLRETSTDNPIERRPFHSYFHTCLVHFLQNA